MYCFYIVVPKDETDGSITNMFYSSLFNSFSEYKDRIIVCGGLKRAQELALIKGWKALTVTIDTFEEPLCLK